MKTKAKYFGVITFDGNGNTEHVNVYRSFADALIDANRSGGLFEQGIDKIISRCNWWNDKDTTSYKRMWVINNAV